MGSLDATFLELEDADAGAHMHIGAVLIFEPHPAKGGAPPLDDVVALLRERLRDVPRYHQRLSASVVGRARRPEWVPDEGFDPADNVRRAALPAPGGTAELDDWLSEYFAQRLDRAHPLWQIVLLEGLEGGRWALATKTHHCLVDGVASADVAYMMLDSGPEAGAMPALQPPQSSPEPAQTSMVRRFTRAPAAAARALSDPRGLVEAVGATAELLVRDELIGAPPCSINTPIGVARRYRSVTLSLDDLKRVRSLHGGTVNDVVLSVVAGGLRALLTHRGEPLPARGLSAMVPVDIRPPGTGSSLGNQVSSLFVHLPVALRDPVARHRATVWEAERLKAGHESEAAATMVALGGFVPPMLHSLLARSLFATRLFNLTVTNVPGPRTALYALGCRMTEVLPLVPLAADHALGVACFSYDGALTLGVIADRDAIPDVDVFTDGVRLTLTELLESSR